MNVNIEDCLYKECLCLSENELSVIKINLFLTWIILHVENKLLVKIDITLTLKAYNTLQSLPPFWKSFKVEHGYTILISTK